MAHERRRAPHCPLIASVELIEPERDVHLRARISDLSLVGCYLEIAKMLPVGTEVRLHITHNESTFIANGLVARCEPNTGMGIRSTDIQLDQQQILEQWLAALVRDKPSANAS
jgi:PilZ domain